MQPALTVSHHRSWWGHHRCLRRSAIASRTTRSTPAVCTLRPASVSFPTFRNLHALPMPGLITLSTPAFEPTHQLRLLCHLLDVVLAEVPVSSIVQRQDVGRRLDLRDRDDAGLESVGMFSQVAHHGMRVCWTPVTAVDGTPRSQ